MKRLGLVLMLFAQVGLSQIKDLGTYYSVSPYTNSIFQDAHTAGVFADFQCNKKFTIRPNLFYGSINQQYEYSDEFVKSMSSHLDWRNLITSFSGSWIGVGVGAYYNIFTKNRFSISPGLNASLMFFTKADANYASFVFDTLDNVPKVEYNTHSSSNHRDLLDNKPDVFQLNLTVKMDYLITKRLSVFVEPFISPYYQFKEYHEFFETIGINMGITWALKNNSSH